jgi:hypothetical protein
MVESSVSELDVEDTIPDSRRVGAKPEAEETPEDGDLSDLLKAYMESDSES